MILRLLITVVLGEDKFWCSKKAHIFSIKPFFYQGVTWYLLHEIIYKHIDDLDIDIICCQWEKWI